MLSATQIAILKRNNLANTNLNHSALKEITNAKTPALLADEKLLDFLKIANCLYRAGHSIISDHIYNTVFLHELQRRTPNHPFLSSVEPEKSFQGKTIALPVKMLSTDKTFSHEGIKKWLQRIEKSALTLQLDYKKLPIKLTPKLDGFAAYDDGKRLYTRGDGNKGTDISRVFARGLAVGGNTIRGQGAGEIVVSKTYFHQRLAKYFDNSRNFQASIIKEKELNEHALEAIKQQAAIFFPFAQLPHWSGTADELLADLDTIVAYVRGLVDYAVDGVVFEVIDAELKTQMGSTRHHHRWQIAYKNNQELAQVKVIQVIAQTSRSGRVNPVLALEPTRLSGVLISRVSAHHYAYVKTQKIGQDTIIELTRSGLVIPKIEQVLSATEPQIPKQCPSCFSKLVWESDYLYCLNNSQCPAQIASSIEHFFKTLGNNEGFGHQTIKKLHSFNVNSIYSIYQLTLNDLQNYGFGDKIAKNLLEQLQRSRNEAIEDWRFLSAFGIYRMGLGNCERLLQHYRLDDIFTLSAKDIVIIEGFAQKTANSTVTYLEQIKDQFQHIYALTFNLIRTKLLTDKQKNAISLIAGKSIVFTGTLERGNRKQMQKTVKQLGGKVSNMVSSKTAYLIIGANVGTTKINSAKDKGVQIISEDDFFKMLDADFLSYK